MKNSARKIFIFLTLAIVMTCVPAATLVAQTFAGGFPVRINYQELDGVNFGSVDISLTMTLPMGTPLLAREAAVESCLSALHDIWNLESIHDDVRGFLGPVVPMDVQRTASSIAGADFIIGVIDAFETVADAGYSRFQGDVDVRATERVRYTGNASQGGYPDAPRFFAWVIGESNSANDNNHDNWVTASLVNYSASILSFRSEYGRFPNSLAELRETSHLIIDPLNPYTGAIVQSVSSPSPGNIQYQRIDNNHVMLFTYIQAGNQIEVVRREINLPSTGSYDLLYRSTADLSENDKQVARYIFQISSILNEYFYSNGNLPYSVPQCEAEGFAYVSFRNPYAQRDVQQAESLAAIQPGDYTYHRISPNEFFLVGYGSSGAAILSISKNFSSAAPEMGILRSQ